jgi:hypothetical protein
MRMFATKSSTPAAGPTAYRRTPAVRHILRGPQVQPKFAVDNPAERGADQVMRMPDTALAVTAAAPAGTVQRACAECEGDIRRKAGDVTPQRTPSKDTVRRQVGDDKKAPGSASQNGGSPLSPDQLFIPYNRQDETRLQGVRDRMVLEAQKSNLGSVNAGGKNYPPLGYQLPPPSETKLEPGRQMTDDERLYSDLMNQEMEWRKKHYGKTMQAYYESTGTITNPYVAAQMYRLRNKSGAVRLFDPTSPTSIWTVIDAAGGFVASASPYGVVPEGMSSKRDAVPTSFPKTLVGRPMGPLYIQDKAGRTQHNYATTGKAGYPKGTKQLKWQDK